MSKGKEKGGQKQAKEITGYNAALIEFSLN